MKNPVLLKNGATPTAALAIRAEAKTKMDAAKELLVAARAERGMTGHFDIKMVRAARPAKLDASGNPVAVVKKWPK